MSAMSTVLVVLLAGVTAGLVSAGHASIGVVAMVLIGFLVVARLGTALANDHDRSWFPLLLPLAYVAKVFGIFGRYYMVTGIYGYGDSLSYHRAGETLVHTWRAFQVPTGTGGSASTRFTEVVTGFLYMPGVPSLLGGFLVFGFLAFVGCLCFYLAFRRRLPSSGLRTYAVILFFLPSLLFWPSSIGKDALMIFALGVAALGASVIFDGRYISGIVLTVPALLFAAAIRSHVAAMLLGALVFGLVLAKGFGHSMTGLGRLVVTLASVVALFMLASTAMDRLGIGTNTEDLQEFLSEQERLTGGGGSSVTGAPVSSPLDVPEATLRVLFRPLPYEAHNFAAILSALEGTAFLGLVVWKFRSLWANIKMVRRYPYLLFALIFTGEFVVAFSALFNLGILARQRTQVLPLFLALLIGLGWQKAKRVDLSRLTGASPRTVEAGVS